MNKGSIKEILGIEEAKICKCIFYYNKFIHLFRNFNYTNVFFYSSGGG
jgi:AAA+ superfamily predicted ATPase